MKKFLGILVLGLLLSGKAYTHEGEHKPLVCIPESERTSAQLKQDELQQYFHRLSKLQQDCLLVRVEELENESRIKKLNNENYKLKNYIKHLKLEIRELELKYKKLETEKSTATPDKLIERIIYLEKRLKSEKQKLNKLRQKNQTIVNELRCSDVGDGSLLKATANTNLYKDPDSKSLVVTKIKKDQELILVKVSKESRNWYLVSICNGKFSTPAFVEKKFVSGK